MALAFYICTYLTSESFGLGVGQSCHTYVMICHSETGVTAIATHSDGG